MKVTRRTFLHGLVAVGATATITGCGSDGGDSYYQLPPPGGEVDENLDDLSQFNHSYASCPHNCGTSTRCVVKLWVKDGRVRRVTSDDSEFDVNGNPKTDKDNYNCSRNLCCAKGRAYKYRLNHSGRLRYPMKQTKKRGDLTGFVRITWQQALNEIMRKYRAIYAKWGHGAIYGVNRNNNISTSANAGYIGEAINSVGQGFPGMYSSLSYHQFDYCLSMTGVPRGGSLNNAYPYIRGGAIKNIVSFGANTMTTAFSTAYGYMRVMQDLKANGGKHYVIAPEFSDTNIAAATDWIQIRNYTDSAVVAAMIYEMLKNTFDESGNVISNPWLDVDYLDTCVYGFFDSPEYWLKVSSANGYFNGTDTTRGESCPNPTIPSADPVGTMYMTAADAGADKWELECGDFWVKTGGSLPVGTIAIVEPTSLTGWTAHPAAPHWVKFEDAVNNDAPVGTIVIALPSNTAGWNEGIGYWIVTGPTDATGDGAVTGKVVNGLPDDTTGYTYQRDRWKRTDVANVYAYTEPVRKINAVPSGRSYASWIMGDDDRLTNAVYNARSNYTAQKYGTMKRAGKCSMTIGGEPAHSTTKTTDYYTKKDYMKKKDAEWAEAISGVPAATIRELARFYSDTTNHPILTRTCGGLQKFENGVPVAFALLGLNIITKNWGNTGTNNFEPVHYSSGEPANRGTLPYANNSDHVLPTLTYPSVASAQRPSGGIPQPVPQVSVKDHMSGYTMAFLEEMKLNGFTGPEPEWDGETRYPRDDAGAKTFIKYKRDDKGDLVTFVDSDGQSYFDYEGRTGNGGSGTPVFSGKRFLVGTSATPFQQNIAASWSAAAFAAMPLAGDPDDPDTFCFTQTDMYLSPQVRFCDYALPLAQTLESVIANDSIGGQRMATLPIQKPVGEAKDGWEAGFLAWNEQSKLGNFNDFKKSDNSSNTVTVPANLGYTFIGEQSPRYISAAEKQRKLIEERCNLSSSRFYGMTVEKAIGEQFAPKTPQAIPATNSTISPSALRARLNTYLSGTMADPFINDFGTGNPSGTNNGFAASINAAIARTTSSTNGTSGSRSPITFAAAAGIPQDPRKMTVYAEYAVYRWTVAYNRLHAWLPIDKRGQKNEDYEGDPRLRPIPMYYAFEDDFNEAYGVHNSKKGITRDVLSNWKTVGARPASADMSKIKDRLTLTVGTTHDRFRTHSTQNENPLMREQHHRVLGGGPANDWNEYSVVPEVHSLGGLTDFNPMINTAVQKKNPETASWHEFWMNPEDAAAFNIKDGELLRLSNPIGAVRVIARLSKRVVRGHGNLHQGGWYDPNPIDGVDDGGCANTIMAVRYSKFDNGNAQQSTYVLVEKETKFFGR